MKVQDSFLATLMLHYLFIQSVGVKLTPLLAEHNNHHLHVVSHPFVFDFWGVFLMRSVANNRKSVISVYDCATCSSARVSWGS